MTIFANPSRRVVLAGLLAPTAAALAATAPGQALQDQAGRAYTFAAPLLEMAKVRARSIAAGQQPGAFHGRRDLATPAQRTVTMPNNDTVYASAFVDLDAGPAVFTTPAAAGRYASLQVMDFYSNNIVVVSSRTGGGAGRTVRVIGPNRPHQPGDVVSPTRWIWALARVVVDGAADLPAALAIRDGFRLTAGAGDPHPAAPAASDDPFEILAAAQRLMTENAPRPEDRPMLQSFAPLGLGPGRTFEPARFDADARRAIVAGVRQAQRRARDARSSGVPRGGWYYNHPQTGVFGRNYGLRAAVATFGLAAFPPQEAAYLRAIAPDGSLDFSGPGPWRLSFAADRLPPVNAFWSVTLYEPTAGGQYFLIDNPLNRYALGDRSHGLRWNVDHSLDIWIARTDPGGERTDNWLPAPRSGPFAVVLRAYLPKPALLDGRYRAPAVIPA